MIVGSFNIRGGVSTVKRKMISHIINRGKDDMFLIQETKLADVSIDLARNFWGKKEIEFSFTATIGRSGEGAADVMEFKFCECNF